MSVWQVLVFAVMKQGLDVDFDRLAHLASNHHDIHRLAGLSDLMDGAPISAATLVKARIVQGWHGACVLIAAP